MKNFNKKFLSVLVSAAMMSLLVKSAFAVGSAASSLAAGVNVKPRINNAVSAGHPLDRAAKGVKVFGADGTIAQVLDEKGTSPTTGGLASLEIGTTIGAVAACYLLVYDSSNAADTTEAGSVARLLVPPLIAVTSANSVKEYLYPRQFHKGLVVLVGGPSASTCRATVGWLKNGGDN